MIFLCIVNKYYTYRFCQQTMKNLSENKTPQVTYAGDVIGGSVVRGMFGAFLFPPKV